MAANHTRFDELLLDTGLVRFNGLLVLITREKKSKNCQSSAFLQAVNRTGTKIEVCPYEAKLSYTEDETWLQVWTDQHMTN